MENLGGFRSFPAIDPEGFSYQLTNNQILNLLQKKRLNPHFSHHTVKDIDHICSLEPWDLPWESDMEPEEKVCYFFYEPYYKYKDSNRAHRKTNEGYWKTTGKGSNIIAGNGLTGSKKILTFRRCSPDSKKARTKWIMHEYHVKDKPGYKKEFVLCRIERKWDNKHGIPTPDEGESSQQMVSPTQILPGDHLISSGNHIDGNSGNHIEQHTLTNLQLPPNDNLISPSGNHIEKNSLPNQELLPDQNMISNLINHIEQTTLASYQSLLTRNMVPSPGNHIVQNTLSNTQLQQIQYLISYLQNIISNLQLQQNHYPISCFGNHSEQNTIPQQVPYHNLISHPPNHIEESTLSNSPLSSNHNPISSPRNHIDEDDTFTESQLPVPPNSVSQDVTNPLVDKNNVVENTSQEENHQLGEFNAGGSYNGLNYASFSAPPSPNFQEMEFSYRNSSVNSCDFFNSHFDSEQQRAFQDELSPEETGQTHTPDFISSKSDGGTHAEDSSDANTETFDAWLDKLLLENNA